MAVSLALVTGAVWSLLAVVGLFVQRRQPQPRWDLWDTLRGARTLAGLLPVAAWRRSSRLLGDGHHLGVHARMRGDVRSASKLTCAELASTRSVVEQIDAALAEHARQLAVLQAATAVQPLAARQLHWIVLRSLARLEACASPWLGRLPRLRVRLGLLRVAVRLLAWRLRALDRRVSVHTLESLPGIRADVAALSRAATLSRRTLLGSWRASQSMLAGTSAELKSHPGE